MTNIRLPIEEYDDIEIQNLYTGRLSRGYREEDVMAAIYARGRDNARTPMQWSAQPYAGFSRVKPWLPVNPNYREINARAALEDPGSVFYFYQTLIALRKRYPVFREGEFTLLEPESEKLFVYTRETAEERLLVICNFTGESVPYQRPAEFAGAWLLLGNYGTAAETLRPYEAQMFYGRKQA